MLRKIQLLILAITLSTATVLGQIDPPKLEPTPTTGKQSALIDEGIALHDQGRYDEAISKYEEVLTENPNNVLALYEMSFSYSMKKDYKKSLELAYKGTKYKSKLLPGFYLQVGNNLDLLGEPNKSVEAYKAGIKLEPKMPMLHYNLAVTYRNMGNPKDSRSTVKQAIIFNPNHPGSHILLSTLWQQGGYKTPALLAASRFLVLEPDSQRALAALKLVQEIMAGGVSAGQNPNEIKISMDANVKKDEGDFGAMDLVLGLGRAAGLMDKNKGKTQIELLIGQFNLFFAAMSEQTDKGDKEKFTWLFYAPYFVEMKRRNLVEPFVYFINQSSESEDVQNWLRSNKPRVNEFLAWSKSYPWPKTEFKE